MSETVVVRNGAAGKYACEVEAGAHRLAADEPAALGGSDGGPTPMELLAGALGACTAITLRMYAERKGWDLRGVQVAMERTPTGAKEGPTEAVHRRIRLDGALDAEQRKRLIEVAERCPVHRALTAGVRVTTEEVPG